MAHALLVAIVRFVTGVFANRFNAHKRQVELLHEIMSRFRVFDKFPSWFIIVFAIEVVFCEL